MTCENLAEGQKVIYRGRAQIIHRIDRAGEGHLVDVYDARSGLHTPFDDLPGGILHALGYEISALKPVEGESVEA